MNICEKFMKSWDLRTIGRWFLLPMAVAAAIFLPPLLLSFILTFVLIVSIQSLHPCFCTLAGRTHPGNCKGIRSRSPPIS